MCAIIIITLVQDSCQTAGPVWRLLNAKNQWRREFTSSSELFAHTVLFIALQLSLFVRLCVSAVLYRKGSRLRSLVDELCVLLLNTYIKP